MAIAVFLLGLLMFMAANTHGDEIVGCMLMAATVFFFVGRKRA